MRVHLKRRVAERQPADGAQVHLVLLRHARVHRVVPRVVRPWRHLVEQHSAVGHRLQQDGVVWLGGGWGVAHAARVAGGACSPPSCEVTRRHFVEQHSVVGHHELVADSAAY